MAVTSVMRPSSPEAVTWRGLSGSAFFPLPVGPLKEICPAASYGLADSGLPPPDPQAVTPAPREITSRVQLTTVRVRGRGGVERVSARRPEGLSTVALSTPALRPERTLCGS